MFAIAFNPVEGELGRREPTSPRAEPESGQRKQGATGEQPGEPRPAPQPAERVPVRTHICSSLLSTFSTCTM